MKNVVDTFLNQHYITKEKAIQMERCLKFPEYHPAVFHKQLWKKKLHDPSMESLSE